MIPLIFVHVKISRLPVVFGHLADSKSISWNLTTTFHSIPDCNNTADVPSLLDVQLVLQFLVSNR